MVCSSVAKIAVRVLATLSGICFIVTQDIPSCVSYFLIFHSSLSVCLSVPLSLSCFSPRLYLILSNIVERLNEI